MFKFCSQIIQNKLKIIMLNFTLIHHAFQSHEAEDRGSDPPLHVIENHILHLIYELQFTKECPGFYSRLPVISTEA